MTNHQITTLYNQFLRDYCHCHEDEVGNRPCDNGALCDRCMTREAQEIWKKLVREE